MKKKSLLLFLFCALSSSSLLAEDLWIEAKVGYFRFSSHLLRQIFSDGGADFQLSMTSPLAGNWNFFASVDYFSQDGHSLGGGDPTSIEIIPITMGLKYFFPLSCNTDFYLAAGPRYFFVNMKNPPYIDSRMSGHGLGGDVGCGFNYRPFCSWLVSLSVDYSFKTLHFITHIPNVSAYAVNVGGLTVGASLGYLF